ncbi:hypothetical protein Poly30_15270 [Planctomycetes bacterium Poly30]|uniref:Uncharacterized protein n=1 Tax=Saltatorellus ferox TaxID=2528018 RepID=A0A518EPL8_9BACT|nr:hypothetical protein Poly30_15270 [Planctomycetes bacterium Poly30]
MIAAIAPDLHPIVALVLQKEIAGDDAFALISLVAGIAVFAGLAEIVQRRAGKGFPIPLLIYSHLLLIVVFVYSLLALVDTPVGADAAESAVVGRWPLYATLLPLPFIVLGRLVSTKKS